MAKKANDKKGKAKKSADALKAWVEDQAHGRRSTVSDEGAIQSTILKLKGLFGVMSDLGTGADTRVDSNNLAMLADLATSLLGEIEAYHFGRA